VRGRIRSAWQAARRSLGYGPVGRWVSVREDDVFLVSYPRSGNTWLRFIVANLAAPNHPADFLDIEKRVPDIYVHSERELLLLESPRRMKSHEYYDPRYHRVLYVVRDPRNVAPSYYRWHLSFGGLTSGYPATLFLERFLNGSLDPYGSWGSHVGSWLGARQGDPSFHVLRYEDLVDAPTRVAGEICQVMGIRRSEAEIAAAVERSNRDRMRHLEQSQRAKARLLQGRRSDIPFVGAGDGATAADASEEYLRSPEAHAEISKRFAGPMAQAGYH
jgi:Sulfotransferase domain